MPNPTRLVERSNDGEYNTIIFFSRISSITIRILFIVGVRRRVCGNVFFKCGNVFLGKVNVHCGVNYSLFCYGVEYKIIVDVFEVTDAGYTISRKIVKDHPGAKRV